MATKPTKSLVPFVTRQAVFVRDCSGVFAVVARTAPGWYSVRRASDGKQFNHLPRAFVQPVDPRNPPAQWPAGTVLENGVLKFA